MNGTVEVTLTEDRTQTMYDLTVEDVHTFSVGEGNWVVHNETSNCAPSYSVFLRENEADIRAGIWTANYNGASPTEADIELILISKYANWVLNFRIKNNGRLSSFSDGITFAAQRRVNGEIVLTTNNTNHSVNSAILDMNRALRRNNSQGLLTNVSVVNSGNLGDLYPVTERWNRRALNAAGGNHDAVDYVMEPNRHAEGSTIAYNRSQGKPDPTVMAVSRVPCNYMCEPMLVNRFSGIRVISSSWSPDIDRRRR